ncbi:hypothetical protein [Herbiconiux sp. VKM Ac-2851]|uniref:hypothetical protein n=1 Tax=Herbiconiux sp. VKM Ac-2851 TaxID=2739025 RepID=UPI0015672DA2|nr:hypothetical protein [Herbiconiux sp. VKM Ac-2851]NQX37171.1 hypothetical protein [Herbiconiux sp. VKM Ac-2851]
MTLTRVRPAILISTLSAAAAGVGAIIALYGMLGSPAAVTTLLLVIFVAARASISFLRMDPPGSPVTRVGRVHKCLAFSAFGSAIAAAFVSAGALHDAGFSVEATWSTIFAIVGAIGAVGLPIERVTRHRGLFGLFELLIYLGFIAWFLLIGVTAINAS